MLKIAINGYGRIGRSFVRALAEREAAGNALPVRLVAINDLGRAEDLLYLTRYDTTHGRFPGQVDARDGQLYIDGHAIRVLCEPDPARRATKEHLTWPSL